MTGTRTTADLVRSLYSLSRTGLAVARSEHLTFLAAAIAYYAFVSLVPLALVGLAVASHLGGPSLSSAVVDGMSGLLTPHGANLVETALESDAGREEATLVGLLVLSWSGLRVFRGLDVAFSRIYDGRERETIFDQFVDATTVLGAVALATAATTGLVAALPLDVGPFGGITGPVTSAFVLPVVFLPLYYLYPDQSTSLGSALPGAVFAGVGWSVLAWLFSLYASVAGTFRLYGVLGAVLLALTWFYVGSLLVLLGAVLNAVLAGRGEDRQLQLTPLRRDSYEATMREGERRPDGGETVETVDTRSVDPAEVAELREEIEAVADDLEEKTVAREDLESDLREYVRWRQRRGHARGWGPYLVLLYGTIMTLGAFYFLSGGWAVLAMVVVWLSTLGLYALMLIVGLVGTAVGVPGRIADRLRSLR